MMYKQSAGVLALLFATCDATSISKEQQKSVVSSEPERVHILEPIAYQNAANSPQAFPSIRTTFYAQAEPEGGVFGDSKEPKEEKKEEPKVNGETGSEKKPVEKVAFVDPLVNRAHSTFYDKRNSLWRESASEEGPEMLVQRAKASDEKASFAQRPFKDIGRDGYDKDVFHFVREDSNVQPTPWPRRETPFDYNGSDPKSHFMSRNRRDIGEKGLDEEVHGFASNNNMVQPIPHARRDSPYEYNGYKNQYPAAFSGVRFFRPQRDIGEGKIDEEVHGFASANNMVPPIPNARRKDPYEYNGHKNQYPSFTGVRFERPRRDIGEKGLDEEVHGFASSNNMVLPIPHARRDSPYEYNGYKNLYPEGGFIVEGRPSKDIGEKGLDEEVHGFASSNNMVLPIPHARRDSPYEYNGYKNLYPAGFVSRRDVGEKGMDEEVHGLVSANNMVLPIPHARR